MWYVGNWWNVQWPEWDSAFKWLSYASFGCSWYISSSMTMRHYFIGRFCSESTSLLFCCHVICAQQQFCYFSSWLKVNQNPQHGSQWGRFATALAKLQASSISSALCGKCSLCKWTSSKTFCERVSAFASWISMEKKNNNQHLMLVLGHWDSHFFSF